MEEGRPPGPGRLAGSIQLLPSAGRKVGCLWRGHPETRLLGRQRHSQARLVHTDVSFLSHLTEFSYHV